MKNTFKLIKQKENIKDWFEARFNGLEIPFYSSIDLRNAHYKIAPVDANLFPAGFNNLNERLREIASKAMKVYLEKYCCKRILLIPENYTRNKPYIDNILTIKQMLDLAGFDTRVGLFHSEKSNLIEQYETIVKESCLLKTESGFTPDIVILNRDMTSHIPDQLQNIKQNVIPNPLCGWYNRKKFEYFKLYQKVALEFCREFQVDPWLISALTENFSGLDFNDNLSLEKVAVQVDSLLSLIQENYDKYQIKTEPYVFIKANNGTYGMGIITATSGKDVLNLNKKKRNKMHKVKEGVKIDSVIIQEGVPTIDVFQGITAEPLIYYIGKTPVSYLYRYNKRKDVYSSLNAIDCKFSDVSHMIERDTISLWDIISKLAVLALAVEISSLQ